MDTLGTLVDSAGQTLVENDDAGDAANFSLMENVSAGTYYVRVQNYGTSTGTYQLVSSFQPDDHGNTPATASLIRPNSTTSGNLEVSGDEDLFRIDIPAGAAGTLRVWTTGEMDTLGTLVDSAGQTLVENDDADDALNFSLVQNVSAGTYYVRVQNYGTSIGTYQLVSSFQTGVQPDDHGNTPATASLINPNSTTSGNLEVSGDEDLFRIDIPAGAAGTLRVWTTGEMDTLGTLVDSAGQTVVENDDAGDDLNFSLVQNVSAGTYYVRVQNYGTSIGTYQIVSSFQVGAQPDDHGNTPATASLINPNSTTSGNLEVSGDEDLFRIDIPAGAVGALRVWTTGEMDTLGTLVDSAGQTIVENDDAGDALNFSLVQNVSVGTYYVRVQNYRASTGSYQIVSSFQTDDHGNTPATASLINPNSTTSGNLEVSGDEDLFRIDIPVGAAGTLSVWTTGGMDTLGTLVDSAGQTLVENDDAGVAFNFSLMQNVSHGTYYVLVQNYGTSIGTYQLVSSFEPTSNPEISMDDPVITNFDVLRRQLTFTEVPKALTYRVEWSATMAPGSWSSEAPGVAVIQASGAGEQTVVVGIIAPPCFYRVVAVLDRLEPPDLTGFALIPAGPFQMGDPFAEGEDEERLVHRVDVSAFYMRKTEVTKAEWDQVRTWGRARGYTDLTVGEGQASNHPVQTVTWWDAIQWCNACSEKDGLTPVYTVNGAVLRTGTTVPTVNWAANGYRLPTEAEWEKAARGGLDGKRFPGGDTISHSQANYESDILFAYDVSSTRGFHPTYWVGPPPYTSPTGSFAANGYGLHDMVGNVWEWCWDWIGEYTSVVTNDPRGPSFGGSRILRGGSWFHSAWFCRVAFRYANDPSRGNSYDGFRPVRGRLR